MVSIQQKKNTFQISENMISLLSVNSVTIIYCGSPSLKPSLAWFIFYLRALNHNRFHFSFDVNLLPHACTIYTMCIWNNVSQYIHPNSKDWIELFCRLRNIMTLDLLLFYIYILVVCASVLRLYYTVFCLFDWKCESCCILCNAFSKNRFSIDFHVKGWNFK